jgi:hypothetical protein
MKSWVAFPLMALAACSSPMSIDAKPDVAKFHRQLASEDYAAIWQGTADDMRSASNEVDFTKFLAAINRKLGKVVQTEQVGWRTNVSTGGTFAVVQMETRFERGKGSETFTFRQNGNSLKLAGYNLNSNEMMIN